MNFDIQPNIAVHLSLGQNLASLILFLAKPSVDGKTMVTRRSGPTFPDNSDRQTRDLLIPDKMEPRSLALSVISGEAVV